MGIEIRNIAKNEKGELIAFHRRNYRAGHILEDPRYLDWQFGEFPRRSDSYSILGAWSAGRLLGVFGYTETPYLCFGKRCRAVSLGHLMVEPSVRHLGIGALLLARVKKSFALAIDHGLTRDAVRLFTEMGFKGETLSRFARVLSPDAVAKAVGAELPVTKAELPKSDFRFVRLRSYDPRLALLMRSVREKYPITVERSKRYLEWRYFHHPLISYALFAAERRGRLHSFVAVRIEGPDECRAGRIIDCISEESAEAFPLLSVAAFCRDAGAHYVDYYFSGPLQKRALRNAGFADAGSGLLSLLPSRLNPPVFGGSNAIDFVVQARRGMLRRASHPRSWYTTKGGGDQDRAY